MNKVVSFSLWGHDPKYTVGALKNAELAEKIYPDWKCYFFVANSVPSNIIEKLILFPNTKIIHKNDTFSQKSNFINGFKFKRKEEI